MKPITHHLTESQITWLRAESARTGLPVADLIRRAIDDAMTSRQQPPVGSKDMRKLHEEFLRIHHEIASQHKRVKEPKP